MAHDPKIDSGSEQTWSIDPSQNLKEALGFLKDWVTTFLTLQTSIIAAVAAFVGVKGAGDFVHLTCGQGVSLGIAASSSLVSILAGLYLLNMIPAAAQRKPDPYPAGVPKDLFSIATQENRRTIRFWTDLFRHSFLVAIIALIAFVLLKVTSIF
jgi:hypothetical protein